MVDVILPAVVCGVLYDWQVASSAAGARYLIANGHLRELLNAAGGGSGGESMVSPDPLLGTSALRTSARLFVKAAGFELDVSSIYI